MPSTATMPAITHVALTVTDLAVSEAWYTEVLGVHRCSTRTPVRSGTSCTRSEGRSSDCTASHS